MKLQILLNTLQLSNLIKECTVRLQITQSLCSFKSVVSRSSPFSILLIYSQNIQCEISYGLQWYSECVRPSNLYLVSGGCSLYNFLNKRQFFTTLRTLYVFLSRNLSDNLSFLVLNYIFLFINVLNKIFNEPQQTVFVLSHNNTFWL